MEAEGE